MTARKIFLSLPMVTLDYIAQPKEKGD